MTQPRFSSLLLSLSGILLFCGCQDTNAKDAIASYSYSAGDYSETVALRPDGKYLQTETQQASQTSPTPLTLKQTGTWRLLDKPDGTPLALPTLATSLPKDAIVEIKAAFPFGQTFENQSPFSHQINRTIPANEFIVKKT